MLTANDVLDLARVRHHSFTESRFPNGALRIEANQRLRTLYTLYADALMPILGTTADAPIAAGVFPLPAAGAITKLAAAWGLDGSGTLWPIDLVPLGERFEQPQTRDLQAYVLASELRPVRAQGLAPFTDGWTDIVSVRFAYLAAPDAFSGLADTVTLPDLLAEAVVAHLAHRMALSSPDCSASEKATFAAESHAATLMVSQMADTIAVDAMTRHVVFRD